MTTETFTLGVEEEFQVVDGETGALVPRSHLVVPHARTLLGATVDSELNLCQIEIETPICTTLEQVRAELVRLRQGVGAAAAQAGCGVAALGTHPLGMWQDQAVDRRNDRYRRMEEVYQIVARQQVICGCHVHVGIAERELAIAAMNRARPWLPVLLALSANSPYWQGADTGFASYRLQVWQRWPTSGMPPALGSPVEFKELIDDLQAIDAIEDPTFLYWYVRPSVRHATLEFRAADVCAVVDDAVALAGLVRALAWTCALEATKGIPDRSPRLEVLDAAMWRASRYGLEGKLVSPTRMLAVPAAEAVRELLDYLRNGLEAHGDWAEVSRLAGRIVERGNGARLQRAALARRQDPHDVIAWARATTLLEQEPDV